MNKIKADGITVISVLIDTCNHERFIADAINSVLSQALPPFSGAPYEVEVLVIDDGSTDRTPEIVSGFAPRVRLIRKKNGGQASAFNTAIPQTRGEIVFFLDGDDWWAADKIGTVLKAFRADSALGAVGHAIFSYRHGRETCVIAPEKDLEFRLKDGESAINFLRHKALLGTSRFAARRSVLLSALPVPEGLTVEADEYLFTLCSASAKTAILASPLTYYRLHDNNLFQIAGKDAAKAEVKSKVLRILAETLPPKLERLCVSPEAIDRVRKTLRSSSERIYLAWFGGSPIRTYLAERAQRQVYGWLDPGYGSSRFRTLLGQLTCLGALFMPPRWFYALQLWRAGDELQTGGSGPDRLIIPAVRPEGHGPE